MNPKKKLTNFVSEIDRVIAAYNKEHPELSEAQLKEVRKYRRIYKLRDGSDKDEVKSPKEIWSEF